jgi:DHA3 family tetracycline resistance protein-like MFS transporter
MIGRVSSLDWVLSLGLAPLSYALTGPIAAAIGARPTLLWCGLISGGVLAAVFLLVPGVRHVALDEEATVATAEAA